MKTQFRQAVEALEPEHLQEADAGANVQALQRTLKALSLYTATVDGCFGPKTAAATRKLQAHCGLEETGQLDMPTWYALSFWVDPSVFSSPQGPRWPMSWSWPFRSLRLSHNPR
ncbi:MAG: peptidoglycan-binding protein [Elainellaceae cyanobacterium]